ncbi:MAG: FG-GAP-like repeat-containing protein [Deltaproteobacteria bacterium]|nr:FG-GAP-like repeat-containing protein [Deltaproteobacteria bacterium]
MKLILFYLSFLSLLAVACSDSPGNNEFAIDSVHPLFASKDGGETITIKGSGFKSSIALYIGKTKVELIEITKDTLVATMPFMTTGGLYDLTFQQGEHSYVYPSHFNVRGSAAFFNIIPFAQEKWPFIKGNRRLFSDLDTDGDVDIFSTANGTAILHINKDGGLSQITTSVLVKPGKISVLDINGDEYQDFVNLGEETVQVIFGAPENLDYAGELTLDGGTPLGILAFTQGDLPSEVFFELSHSDNTKSLHYGHFLTSENHIDLITDNTILEGINVSAGILLFDANGDTYRDILVSDGEHTIFYLNNDNNNFSPSPPEFLPQIVPEDARPLAVDFQGEGNTDLLLVSQGDTRLWISNFDGGFTDMTTEKLPLSFAALSSAQVLDFDKDGLEDLLVRTVANRNYLLRYDAEGWFFDYSDIISPTPGELLLRAVDLDGDGRKDLVSVDTLFGFMIYYKNLSGGVDQDGDGIIDQFDNCPKTANLSQKDSDFFPFGCTPAGSCELPSSCTVHFEPLGRKIYLSCSEPMTFEQAVQFCGQQHSEMLVLNNDNENNFVASFITEAVWLGITDQEEEGNFVTLDNNSPDYTNWEEGQPDNYNSSEDCAVLRTSSNKWNDLACDSTQAVVCETSAISGKDGGDACDNCPLVFNLDQEDSDGNGVGDVCEY